MEEVVVTGSRISRANLSSPTQVTTLDDEAIKFSGQVNVSNVMRNLPSVGVSTFSGTNSNFNTTGGGLNTLQLRNLGEDRTLVLVNGRRYVSGLAGSSAVDFNTIPTELIERIEVITGGASAIYGSDALAGVINVILKDSYEGFDVDYQQGQQVQEGDAKTRRVNVTGGLNFGENRGNVVMSGTFSRDSGVWSRNRKGGSVDNIGACVLSDDPDDCDQVVEPFYSSFSEYGRFNIPSTGDRFTVGTGTGPNGTVDAYSSARYGFNRQSKRRISVPTDRYVATMNGSWQFSDQLKGFVETMFARTKTGTDIEPFPLSDSDVGQAIPIDNPFMPQALRNELIASGDSELWFARRMTELGDRTGSSERDTYRVLGGLEGQFAGDYNWNAYTGYGRMKDDQDDGGDVVASKMAAALNAIDGDGNPATLDPICADPVARAAGCVPINLFGKGSISKAAADYVRAPKYRLQQTEQYLAGFTVDGPVVELPAGPLQFALGAEYRKEKAKDVPDPLTQSGGLAGNQEAATYGDYDVKEAFIELEAPLLKDMPFAKEVTIGGAARISDYSTVGSTKAYTGRFSWSPVESVRVRWQYAKAVRAPNIGELYAPGGENFESVTDPCDGVDATTPGNVAANCRSIPSIANRIAATGSFTVTQAELQGTGGFSGKGNQDLVAEKSDSYVFGVVFDRDFDKLGTVNLSVDWFDIKIDNVITEVGRQTAVDFCFNADPADFPNKFCSLLTRDASGPVYQQGEIKEVNSGAINEGTLKTAGVDITALWSVHIADIVSVIPGDAAFSLNWTHTDKFEEFQFGAVVDYLKEIAYPEDKMTSTLRYTLGRLSAQWELNYYGSTRPSNSNPVFSRSVGSYFLNNLHAEFSLTERATLYGGINNLFDKDPPLIPSGVDYNTTGTPTAADVFDPIGRSAYLGVRMHF